MTQTAEAGQATEQFTFEAVLKTTDARHWTAEVPFDGTANELQDAASKIRINTRTVREPDGDQPRIIELAGTPDAVQTALREYASRAIRHGRYTVGDLFENSFTY